MFYSYNDDTFDYFETHTIVTKSEAASGHN